MTLFIFIVFRFFLECHHNIESLQEMELVHQQFHFCFSLLDSTVDFNMVPPIVGQCNLYMFILNLKCVRFIHVLCFQDYFQTHTLNFIQMKKYIPFCQTNRSPAFLKRSSFRCNSVFIIYCHFLFEAIKIYERFQLCCIHWERRREEHVATIVSMVDGHTSIFLCEITFLMLNI